MSSDLGLNPATTGDTIRIPMPPLTEERRRELVKVVKSEGENTRVAIRNIRRDANQEIKASLKEKAITEDEEHRGQESVQKITDQFIERAEQMIEKKETELLEI